MLSAVSIQLDHIFAAVFGIANQALPHGINDEVESFKGHLTDQYRAVVGDFDHITAPIPPLDGQTHGAKHLECRYAGARASLARSDGK
jgi:hypothetical protein